MISQSDLLAVKEFDAFSEVFKTTGDQATQIKQANAEEAKTAVPNSNVFDFHNPGENEHLQSVQSHFEDNKV